MSISQDRADTYRSQRPRSQALFQRAAALFPNGVTHDSRSFDPFPIYVERAKGAYKWDVDGNRYIDYWMGHGALLLGHNHPTVLAAVQAQLQRGTHYGAAHELELEWAEAVCRLMPGAQQVRFTSSGTEASMLAMRLARAATGRPKIIKFRGHFHGWNDYASVGSRPPYDGSPPPGVPAELAATCIVLPDDDLPALERTLAAGNVAAVILEPTGASWGTVPLGPAILAGVRELTRASGVAMIMDEVITGFRLSPGGAARYFGVTADLYVLGKIVAGGLPGAAVAGVQALLSPLSSDHPGGKLVVHQGTFNGNPLSAAAGVSALGIAGTGDPQDRAALLADRLRDGLNAALAASGVPGCAYGDRSLFHIIIDPGMPGLAPGGPLPGFAMASERLRASPLSNLIRRAMLERGVDLLRAGGMVSAAHSEGDIDATVVAFRDALPQLAAAAEQEVQK